MTFSNAERQRRFRQRLKERASGAALGEMARDAIDDALGAVWAILNRETAAGNLWAEVDMFADLAGFKQHWRGNPVELQPYLEGWLDPAETTPITDEQREAISRGLGVVRAAMLDHVPAPVPVKKPRRKAGKAQG